MKNQHGIRGLVNKGTLRSYLKLFIEEITFDYLSTSMGSFMKAENKLEGASNFKACKARIDLILAKNDLLVIVKGKVTEPLDTKGKMKYEKDDITTMRIIVDSTKDDLTPYVSSLES